MRFDDIPSTPLAISAIKGNLAMCKLFLSKGANPNGAPNGAVPLIGAIQESRESVVHLLLAEKVEVNKAQVGTTATMAAAKKSNVIVLKHLLDRRALTDTVDHEGRTALSYAVEYGCVECVRMLRQKNANPELKDRFGKNAAAYVGESVNKNKILQLLKNRE